MTIVNKDNVFKLYRIHSDERRQSSKRFFLNLSIFKKHINNTNLSLIKRMYILPEFGWSDQKEPFPGLSGVRGIFTKQSLKLNECRIEFCQRCWF